jgi:hypothetical protein
MGEVFKFDVERHIEYMEHATGVDLMAGLLTAYGVMCLNDDNCSSHGGQVTAAIDGDPSEGTVRRAIDAAVARAIDQNEYAAANGGTCRYVPITIGMHPSTLPELNRQLFRIPGVDDGTLMMGDPTIEDPGGPGGSPTE